jgi:hypothetical protein
MVMWSFWGILYNILKIFQTLSPSGFKDLIELAPWDMPFFVPLMNISS